MRRVAKDCGTASGEYVNQLLIKLAPGCERFALRNLDDDAVHVHVYGKVQVHSSAADFGPRLDLLRLSVQDGVTLDDGNLGFLDPAAVEVALDASAATDVL